MRTNIEPPISFHPLEPLESRLLLSTDPFPNNFSFQTAADLGSGDQIHVDLPLDKTRDEFYQLAAAQSGQIAVEIVFSTALSNLGLEIYDSAQNLVSISNGASSTESVQFNVAAGQSFFIKIVHASLGSNTYALLIDEIPDDNSNNPPRDPPRPDPLPVNGFFDAGLSNGIAVDANGITHVAYHDIADGTLRYTTSENGTNWSRARLIDHASPEVGLYADLKLDQNQNPAVAYYDAHNGDLKFARFNGSTWDIETVQSRNTVGLYPSLQFNAKNNPTIAYYQKSGGNLVFAQKSGSSWSIETVASEQDVGRYPDLQYNPNIDSWSIAFENTTDGRFLYAEQPSANTWITRTVDNTLGGGGFISQAFDPANRPAISYYDAHNADLKYAVLINGQWQNQIVAAKRSQGLYTNLFFDAAGIPNIIYFNKTNNSLVNARGEHAGWTFETLAQGGGRWANIARRPDGAFDFTWFNSSTQGVQFAKGAAGNMASGKTDSNGNITLLVDGKALTFQFTDDQSNAPISGLKVALALDPSSRAFGILTAAHPSGSHPIQHIFLEGTGNPPLQSDPPPSNDPRPDPILQPAPIPRDRPFQPAASTNTSAPESSPISARVSKFATGILKSITIDRLKKADPETGETVGIIDKAISLAGGAIQLLGKDEPNFFQSPVKTEVLRSARDARDRANKDLIDNLTDQLFVFSGARALGAAAGKATGIGDLLGYGISATTWGQNQFEIAQCGDDPHFPVIRTEYQTVLFGTTVHYSCGGFISPPPDPLHNFFEFQGTINGQPAPPGASLELISSDNLFESFLLDANDPVNLPPGSFNATLRIPNQSARNINLNVPSSGGTVSLDANPNIPPPPVTPPDNPDPPDPPDPPGPTPSNPAIFEWTGIARQTASPPILPECNYSHNISGTVQVTLTDGDGGLLDPFTGMASYIGVDTAPNVGGPSYCDDQLSGSFNLSNSPVSQTGLRQIFSTFSGTASTSAGPSPVNGNVIGTVSTGMSHIIGNLVFSIPEAGVFISNFPITLTRVN